MKRRRVLEWRSSSNEDARHTPTSSEWAAVWRGGGGPADTIEGCDIFVLLVYEDSEALMGILPFYSHKKKTSLSPLAT